MGQLPVYIQSEQMAALIVGGGKVALRKLKLIHAAKIKVTVIATFMTDDFRAFVEAQQIESFERPYEVGEATPYGLVIAATDSEEVNDIIQQDARHLICRVDHSKKGNIIIPATIRRGRLLLTVSTGGASPLLAKKIMQQLERQFDEQYESYVDFLSEIRQNYRGNQAVLKAVVDERFINMSKSERQKEVFQLISLKN